MSLKTIVYIGDFDLRNQNVQAHLVRNNGKMLARLGYKVFYIGTNRECTTFEEVKKLPQVEEYRERYLELPNTLTAGGLFQSRRIEKTIIGYLDYLHKDHEIYHVITYQAPTYAHSLKIISQWCKRNKALYIVNCADLPVFDSQVLIRRIVMNMNWKQMHNINKRMADGIISVSRYIDNFYKKEGRPSVIIPPLFDELSLEAKYSTNERATFIYAGTPFVINGTATNTKGMKDRLDYIVDIMLKLEGENIPFQLDIVGITLEDYCTCIPRHDKSVRASKNIVFHGRQSHRSTLQKLVAADYMINYRDYNLMTEAGMSTKVVESVSVGTPVVMNDIGDTFMYLEEGVSGIRLTEDFNDNVRTVRALCMKSAEDRKCAKEKTRGKEVFSIERYAQSMNIFLEKVSSVRQKN